LQTLINTYPDSEYLAKAALAIADSYYKEGGTSNLTQSVQEYQNFITFFPFLDESKYAQMQIAMAHYRRMEKPDRDRTFARLAEEALQTFLLKYSDDPRTAEAEQRLREVQEVLAEGEFRVGLWYCRKGSVRACAARLAEMVERFPLYSQTDRALWMLGDAFERGERGDVAALYYGRLVKDYPLSPLVEDAKARLTALGVPVPQPNPEALARMQKERECDQNRPGMMKRSLGILKTGPDVSRTACTGKPNMNPPGEPVTLQTLIPSPPKLGIEAQGGGTSGGTAGPGTGTTTPPPDGNPAAKPPKPESTSDAAAALADPAKPVVKDTGKKKKEEEERKKKQEAEKKKQEESSSKKKKGLRKIIPW